MANTTVATFPGRGIIWTRVRGFGTEPKVIGWGTTAMTASASANVNLFGPQTEVRTVGTSSVLTTAQLGDTYQVTGTIVCAVAGKSVMEAGLFDLTTLSPTTTIAVSLTNSTTSFTVGAVIQPTAGNYYAQLENETVLVTGANSTTLAVTRGALGSAAVVHNAGVPFTVGGDGSSAGGGAMGTSAQTATSIAGTYGGNMFIHADFGAIALNVNDSVSFTFSDTLT